MSRDYEDKNRTAPVESEYKTTLKTEFEPVAIEKNKTNTIQKILLVLMAILVVVIIGLLIYIFTHMDEAIPVEGNTEQIMDDEIKGEKTVLDLKVNGSFSTDLYSKIPIQEAGLEPYYSKTTTMDDISDSQKLLFILKRMEDNKQYEVVPNNGLVTDSSDAADVKKFDMLNVEIAYKAVYGSVQSVPRINADTGHGYVYEYSEHSDCFYGHTAPGGSAIEFKYERDIDRVEQNDSGTEVYVYENLLFFAPDDAHEKSYALYKTTDKTQVIIDDIKKEIVDGTKLYNGMVLDDLFNQYDGQGGNFKHTFKQDSNGNYYWYSTEYLN